MSASPLSVQAVCPTEEVASLQRLPYFLGISGASVGATGLSMHLVVIPPGAKAEPHLHLGYETGIFVLEGTVLTRWGPNLENDPAEQDRGVPYTVCPLRRGRRMARLPSAAQTTSALR
jgi:uncharacterized RmlC-like cupin family protein